MASHSASSPARAPARSDVLLDAAIALAVFGISLGLLAAGENAEGTIDALEVAAAAFASLPLVARRLAPLAVFVVTALASSALQAIADPVGPPVGPTLALFWVASTSDGSRGRTQLTIAVGVAMLAIHVASAGDFPGTEVLFGVVVWGGAWLAGDRARLRRERLAELEERALRAEREADRERQLAAAEERGRIARDLHDSAGHAINVILVHAGMGRLQTDRDPDAAREAFRTIEDVARETVGEIDQLVRVLRDDSATNGTPEVEPPPGLAALDGLVERHRAAGLRVSTTIRGDRPPLPPAVDRGAYRILQEALTNAARHGDGSAEVSVAFDLGAVELTVENPLPPEPVGRAVGGGHGIVGMRERAALLGGSLEAEASDGRFRVWARLPLVDQGA